MSGALAERAFVEKLERVGFTGVDVRERLPFGVAQCEVSPLFTPDLIALMRKLIPEDKQGQVATAIVVCARKP